MIEHLDSCRLLFSTVTVPFTSSGPILAHTQIGSLDVKHRSSESGSCESETGESNIYVHCFLLNRYPSKVGVFLESPRSSWPFLCFSGQLSSSSVPRYTSSRLFLKEMVKEVQLSLANISMHVRNIPEVKQESPFPNFFQSVSGYRYDIETWAGSYWFPSTETVNWSFRSTFTPSSMSRSHSWPTNTLFSWLVHQDRKSVV